MKTSEEIDTQKTGRDIAFARWGGWVLVWVVVTTFDATPHSNSFTT